jgi:two-component system, LytTR family, response regulator
MLRESITDLASKLDPATFLRVHRSAIINMNYVAEIYREGQEEGTVVLLNGQRLKMSKTGRFKLTQLAKL